MKELLGMLDYWLFWTIKHANNEARDERNVALKWQLEVTSHLLACLIVQNDHPTTVLTNPAN